MLGLSQHNVSDKPLVAGDPFRYYLKESGFSEPARLELESLVKAEVTSKLFSCEDAAPLSYDFDKPP